jgi:Spy/CpxP family protein refolding chaperone
MKTKLLIAALVLLIAINIGTLGSYLYFQFFQKRPSEFAEFRNRPPFPPEGRPDLHLEKEQREQLRALLKEFNQETQPLRKQLMEMEQALFLLMEKTPIPMEEIDPKLEEISEIRLQIMRAALKKMMNAKSVLTPEQQRHFFRAMLLSRPGFHEGRRPTGGRPPQPDFKKFKD